MTDKHNHMPLTLGLVTDGMRHCPDPTRGRWDHEKIEELLSGPIARLTFFQELETNIRNSTVVGRAATDTTPDDACMKQLVPTSTYFATIHPTARVGTTTPIEGAGHSTSSDRRLNGSDTCGTCKARGLTGGKADASIFTLAFAKEKGELTSGI